MNLNVVDGVSLIGVQAKDQLKVWMIQVVENAIVITHGLKDGAMQETRRVIRNGKNVGRANETTPHEQAVLEAQARVRKQHDKGYRETEEELAFVPKRPMLASPFDKHKSKIVYPCIEQPKYNGVRCVATLANGGVSLTSRELKPFNVVEAYSSPLMKELQALAKSGISITLDGELYKHGLPLQDIVSAVKAYGEHTATLGYVVYDIINDGSQLDRISELKKLIPDTFKYVQVSKYSFAQNEKELLTKYNEHLLNGYEGLMVRNQESKYRPNMRSTSLLKLKNFKDKEFTIAGATCSNDHEVIWICRFNGEPFEVVPTGTKKERQLLWLSCDNYFGKKLTVRYSDESKKGIPIGNPVGVCVRDYE